MNKILKSRILKYIIIPILLAVFIYHIPIIIVKVMHAKAQTLMSNKMYISAIKILDKATQVNQYCYIKNSSIYDMAGYIYLEQKDYEVAENNYKKALEEKMKWELTNFNSISHSAYMLIDISEHRNNHKKIIYYANQLLIRAKKLKGKQDWVVGSNLIRLQDIYKKYGMLEKAKQVLKIRLKIIVLSPVELREHTRFFLLIQLGDINKSLGYFSKAEENYKSALKHYNFQSYEKPPLMIYTRLLSLYKLSGEKEKVNKILKKIMILKNN